MSFHAKTNFVLVPFSAAVVFDVNERKTTFLRQLKQTLGENVDVSQQIKLDEAKLKASFGVYLDF
jgi:16S rRNA G527 N7-methylase RsmG